MLIINPVVTIAELGHAPGKSMRAYQGVEALHIDKRGLFGDREYMWVEAAFHTNVTYNPGRGAGPGRFLSQREDPVLTGVVPVLVPEGLRLSWRERGHLFVPRREDTAGNRIPVSVWGWEGEAVDQGDEAAQWGEAVLGRPVRLVAISDESPRYVEDNPYLGRVGFCDGYPMTVGSTVSFRRINDYLASLGRPTIPTNRARATIILDGLEAGDENCFPEDYIRTITVTSGDATLVLERYKACGRCPIPDTDQVTGERKTHVRSALGKLGRTGTHANTERFGTEPEIFLTQNFIIHLPEEMPDGGFVTVALGSEVEVTLTDSSNWVPSR
jgi:hypothetical protein